MKALFVSLFVVLILMPSTAKADWPQISAIPDIMIEMNSSGPIMRFTVFDKETPADDLIIYYRSDNKSLIPETDDNISITGSGSDRALVVTPAPGKSGIANLTIFLKDGDGEIAQEQLMVRVLKPPNI